MWRASREGYRAHARLRETGAAGGEAVRSGPARPGGLSLNKSNRIPSDELGTAHLGTNDAKLFGIGFLFVV